MQHSASSRLLSASCLNDTDVYLLSGWSKLHHHRVKKGKTAMRNGTVFEVYTF